MSGASGFGDSSASLAPVFRERLRSLFSVTPRPFSGHSPTSEAFRFYILVAAAAVATCSLSFLNDIVISKALQIRGSLHFALVRWLGPECSGGMLEASSLLLWLSVSLLCAGLAHLAARTHAASFGSGIPEMICSLQHTRMKGLLSKRVLPAKLAGLMLAESAGLPIGKEGPLVHVSAIVSRILLSMRFFYPVRNVPHYADRLLQTSLSIGLCSAFGVPVGGVLFALETGAEDVAGGNLSYWTCMFAAIVGSAVLRILPIFVPGPIVNLLPPVRFHELEEGSLVVSSALLALSAPLGALCGLGGAAFVLVQSSVATRLRGWIDAGEHIVDNGCRDRESISRLPLLGGNEDSRDAVLSSVTWEVQDHDRDSFRVASFSRKVSDASKVRRRWRGLLLVLAVAGLDSLVTFLVPALRGATQGAFLWELVSSANQTTWASTASPLGGPAQVPSMPHDSILFGAIGAGGGKVSAGSATEVALLLACFCWKFLASALALSIQVPSGCVLPSYVMGALLGRAYVAAVQASGLKEVAPYFPEFALVGATAYAASVCRSFSVVVAVSELVGVSRLMLPISLASIVSIFVANYYSLSIFAEAARAKSLPILQKPHSILEGSEPVSAAMRSDVPLVPERLGVDPSEGRRYIQSLLESFPHCEDFPVVAGCPEGAASAPLIGIASRGHIAAFLSASAAAAVGAAAPQGAGGGPADLSAMSAASLPSAAVSSCGRCASSDPHRLDRDVLHVAPQVPMCMPIGEARLALQRHPNRDLFVVRAGCVVGIVGFAELLQEQRGRQSEESDGR